MNNIRKACVEAIFREFEDKGRRHPSGLRRRMGRNRSKAFTWSHRRIRRPRRGRPRGHRHRHHQQGAVMESMPLAVGQALLDLSVASAAQFGGVCDVYSDAACSDVGKEEAVSGVDGVDLGSVFDYLLGEELAFERDLAERALSCRRAPAQWSGLQSGRTHERLVRCCRNR